jgi:tetratricopeptide (TPR) repeat protein
MHLERCLTALQRIVQSNPNEEGKAAVSLAYGERALSAGRAAEAIEHFAQAVRGFESVGVPLELARARHGQARALSRAGESMEAVANFELALEELLLLGARPLAERVARDLSTLAANSRALKAFEAGQS